MILDNFHVRYNLSFYIDHEQMIKTVIYEVIKIGFKFGFTKFCFVVNSFSNKQAKVRKCEAVRASCSCE